MQNAIEAGAIITRLSAKHDIDPSGVVALLAIHALVDVDLPKVAFWSKVSDVLAGRAAV